MKGQCQAAVLTAARPHTCQILNGGGSRDPSKKTSQGLQAEALPKVQRMPVGILVDCLRKMIMVIFLAFYNRSMSDTHVLCHVNPTSHEEGPLNGLLLSG